MGGMDFIKRFFQHKTVRLSLLIGAVLITIVYTSFLSAPAGFPRGHVVTIPEGVSIREAARILDSESAIRSAELFTVLAQLFDKGSGIQSGTYEFSERLSLFGVLDRVLTGNTGASLVRVTIFEGLTVRQMAEVYEAALTDFDTARFITLAREHEGYLFPDTYFFSPHTTPEGVVRAMRAVFDEKVATIQEEIDAFGRPLEDIVIMASILDREARLYETKQIVAGILWKREREDMPLQVDAVFGYIFERETFSPTFDQLEIDSPYNTYKNLGLPPGPIANPGLDSIRAAVNPVDTPYFFYLTGADGRMHYARTFDQHVANRRFLR